MSFVLRDKMAQADCVIETPDMPHVLVWDIETPCRLRCGNGHDGKTDDEIRAELGDKFPKIDHAATGTCVACVLT